jgi:hypothetical protein
MTLNKWLPPVAIIALIVGVVAADRFLRPADAPALVLACADPRTGCEARIDDTSLRVGIDGELKVLQPFTVWLRPGDAGFAPGKVQASFTMEGMDMGFNLYTLRREADGVYRGRVTLPVCVTGRRDWVMTLDIDGDRLALPFVTEL